MVYTIKHRWLCLFLCLCILLCCCPVSAQAEQTPAPVQQEQTPAPVPAVEQQEPTPATVQQTPDQLTAILAEMQTLKQTMQAQNRQNAELIPPTPQSAQDILSSIIAPPKKNGEK